MPKKAFDAGRSAMVSFSLHDFDGETRPHPREIYKNVTPPPEDTAWIPQTLYDAIWALYQFRAAGDRDEFLENRPPKFYKATYATASQAFYDHWTGDVHTDPTAWKITEVLEGETAKAEDDGSPEVQYDGEIFAQGGGKPWILRMRSGVTKREWFAGQAMVGMLGDGTYGDTARKLADTSGADHRDVIAREAYRLADAMIKEGDDGRG